MKKLLKEKGYLFNLWRHMKTLNCRTILMVVTVLVMALKAVAGDTTKANTFLAELSTVTAAELPDHSAELVKQANAKNLDQTTVLVVKAAVGLNPAAAPAIVGSIAHSSPSMAGT